MDSLDCHDAARSRVAVDVARRHSTRCIGSVCAVWCQTLQLTRPSQPAKLKSEIGHVQQSERATFGRLQTILPSITWSTYAWAASMVSSRAWSLRGTRIFAPLADFTNFAPTAEQLAPTYAFSVRGDLFADAHLVRDGKLVILADRAGHAGEELLETYGDNANSIYLQVCWPLVSCDLFFFCCSLSASIMALCRASITRRVSIST